MYSLTGDVSEINGKNYVPLPSHNLDKILKGERKVVIQEVSDDEIMNCLMVVPESEKKYLDRERDKERLYLMSDRLKGRIVPYTGQKGIDVPEGTEFLLEFPKALYSTFPNGYNVVSCLLSGEVKVFNLSSGIEIWDKGIHERLYQTASNKE